MSVVLIIACRTCEASAEGVDPWRFEAEHVCEPLRPLPLPRDVPDPIPLPQPVEPAAEVVR